MNHYLLSDLAEFGRGLLEGLGVPHEDAETTMQVLTLAERWGAGSHGLLRLPRYLARIRRGGIDPAAELVELRDTGVVKVLDGNAGLGQAQAWQAAQMAGEIAAEHGIGVVALGNTNHSGCLGAYVLPGLERELVTIVVSNGPAIMPPWAGGEPLLSTSPIAAGIPAPPRDAIIDLSLSALARGRIAEAARDDTRLPSGVAFDRAGSPTTDPHAALQGMLAPIGGPKGAALALLVESLTAGCVGPALSLEVADIFDPECDHEPQGISHLIVTINPAVIDLDHRGPQRRGELFAAIEASGARLPGSARLASLDGSDLAVPISEQTMDQLVDWASALSVPLPDWTASD